MFSEEVIRAGYAKGVPLVEAVTRLSPPKWRREQQYAIKRDTAKNAALIRMAMETFQENGASARALQLSAPTAVGAQHLPSVISSNTSIRYRRLIASRKPDASTYERRMQTAICSALLTGQYIAIGFEIPRKASDAPIFVPADLLRSIGCFDWKKSRIQGNGLTIEVVRLVHKDWLAPTPPSQPLPALPSALVPDAVGKARPGPKSRKDEVLVAYRELLTRGEIASRDDYKVMWQKIFKLIFEKTGDGKKLDYRTVQRFLKEVC